MTPHRLLLPVAILAAACGGEGPFSFTLWGEDFVEAGIPADEFDDGCTATYDRFVVVVSDRQVLDEGELVWESPEPRAYDLVLPGPTPMDQATLGTGTYTVVAATLAPAASPEAGLVGEADLADVAGHALRVSGTVTCGAASVDFDWAFDETASYRCDVAPLEIAEGIDAITELTIHGDHLFYGTLGEAEHDDGLLGQAIVDADTDADGIVTQAELEATPLAPLGYGTGSFSDVDDLWSYLAAQTLGVAHVDGENHCERLTAP